MQRTLKHLIVLSSIIFVMSRFFVAKAEVESVTSLVATENEIREQMITISRELGVTCSECHDIKNFKSDEKKSFRVSKEHLKLTEMLRDRGFDGKKGPESTCYMCHRGKLHPDYKEPASHKAH